MESSQIYEGMEECHSSESGWTMYIGSPIHGDDDDDDDGDSSHDDDDDDEDGREDDKDDESDDSMASDASSGPSYREHAPRSTGELSERVLVHDKEKRSGRKDENREKKKVRDDESKSKLVRKKRPAFLEERGTKLNVLVGDGKNQRAINCLLYN